MTKSWMLHILLNLFHCPELGRGYSNLDIEDIGFENVWFSSSDSLFFI